MISNGARALDSVRELVPTVAARAAQTDEQARWPAENLRALQAAGLGGLVVPLEAGGLGLGLGSLARVCEILGTACPSTALSFGMHHVASAVLAAKATPDHVSRFLEPIARGEHLTTLALSESGTGAHFYIPQCSMTLDGDQLLLDGTKTFVTNGSHADSYVVSVAAAAPAQAGEFSCVVVSHQDKLAWGPSWTGLGMRGNDARTLRLDQTRVPHANLLGHTGDQIWYVFQVVAPYFLVAMAGTYLGIASAALSEAQNHLATRSYTHDGSSLAHQPLLQHRLGVLWSKVARSRALLYHAAEAGDSQAPDALLALCSTKADLSDCVVDVVNEVMTLLGGKGYGANSAVHRMLRDARAAHVMSPTTDLLRTWTGRALLNVPILAD